MLGHRPDVVTIDYGLNDRRIGLAKAKVAQMYSSIQTGNNVGMQTLDQNLADLVRRNMVAPAEARAKAKFPENFPG